MIGSRNFNYGESGRMIGMSNRDRSGKPDINMKTNILVAVPVSIIAVAALVLSFRSSVNAESLIGFASVFALLSTVALDYRIDWKRPFGRS